MCLCMRQRKLVLQQGHLSGLFSQGLFFRYWFGNFFGLGVAVVAVVVVVAVAVVAVVVVVVVVAENLENS
jgi:hypothetical protein